MLQYLEQEANKTFTENGAATYRSTGSDCVDLFAAIGALRHSDEADIITRFIRACCEDPDTAMKILFYARDIRGGLGERKVFRTIFRWLAISKPEIVRKNIPYVAEFGRYDDLLELMNTPCEKDMLAYLKAQFARDLIAAGLVETADSGAAADTSPDSSAAGSDADFDHDARSGAGSVASFSSDFATDSDADVNLDPGYAAEFDSDSGSHLEPDTDVGFESEHEGITSNISLLAKWLPSINASNALTVRNALKTARAFGMTKTQYRKALSALRASIHIIENDLREIDYRFDYEKQPSRALFKYRKAFLRNDSQRYSEFIARADSGEAVLHAGNIYPYELVEKCIDMRNGRTAREDDAVLNATWNALPDFCGDENVLAVVDTSGSMYCNYARPLPASVAFSLGLYFAEHNKGEYANCFIEFSKTPQLIRLKGKTFTERLNYALSFNEVANTNIEAVFDLILNTAVKHKLPQSELPARIVIISDMEFDSCVRGASETNFEHARSSFARYGYELPVVVFWNVASRNRQQPVTVNDRGVILVSGATPRLFEMVAKGRLDPYAYMMDIIGSKRYAGISA